jgi:tetratricopeptide (TPR) repeat protein
MELDDLRKIIHKVRIQNGVTLQELADQIGCTHGTLSRFEQGKTNLKEEKLNLLLDELDIQQGELSALQLSFQYEDTIDLFAFQSVEAQVKMNALSLQQLNQKLQYINDEIAKNYLRAKRCFVIGDYEEAARIYELILNTDEKKYDSKSNLKAASLSDMSVMRYRENDFKSSLSYLDKAIEIYNQKGERLSTWHNIHYNKALIYFELGNIEESEKWLNVIWPNRAQITGITKIKSYELKASIYQYKGLRDRAVNVLRKALEIASLQDNADSVFYVLMALGNLSFDNKLYVNAERCFQSAIDIRDKLKKTTPGIAYVKISHLYVEQNELVKAKGNIVEALKWAKKSKDMHDLIKAYTIEGKIYEAEGNRYDAGIRYRDALQLAEQYHYDIYKPSLSEHIFQCTN